MMTFTDNNERRNTPQRRASDKTDCVHCTQESTIEEMYKAVGEMYRAVVGTPESEGMASHLRRIAAQTDKHHESLYGNGKMGVVETTRWMKWALIGVGSGVYSIGIKLLYDYFTKG